MGPDRPWVRLPDLPIWQVFREWRALRPRPCGMGEVLDVCSGHRLACADGMVCLEGLGSAAFFERAEEVEDCKVPSVKE